MLEILLLILDFILSEIKRFFVFILNEIRTLINVIINFMLNPASYRHNVMAEYNMTADAKTIKRQRRKLSFVYHVIVLFICFSFLMLYDVADEEQYLFIYEFHKWW